MLVLFSLDFVLHIIFAANDWDIAFRIIAVEIAIVVHFFGPLSLIAGGPNNELAQKRTMRVGTLVGSILTIGYWWAVNGMQYDHWIMVTPVLCILIYLLLISQSKRLAELFYSSEVQNGDALSDK